MSNRNSNGKNRYRWKHDDFLKLKFSLAHVWGTRDGFRATDFALIDGRKRYPVKSSRKKYHNIYRAESLWKIAQAEKERDGDFPIDSVDYTLNPMKHPLPHLLCSSLQARYMNDPLPTMCPRMKKYFRAITILEYEHDHGLISDTEFGSSLLGETCWTPSEKKRFFLALERCGRNNFTEIARRVGPTKTPAQVNEFLQFLHHASQGIGSLPIQHLSAREMTPLYIVQEQHMAKLINDALEVESYGNHLNYLDRPENELLEIWNLSSLTRLFGKTNDMTVLSSTTVNLNELVKRFVSDIMVDLHTQLVNSTDKTVSKVLMNTVIAKRNENVMIDRRFKHLDILTMLDKRSEFHEPFSRNKTASYLAKRRRTMVSDESEEEESEEEESEEEESEEDDSEDESEEEETLNDGYIHVSDDEEEIQWDGDSSSSSSDEEEDPMLQPIDDTDAIPGMYSTRNEQLEHEDAVRKDQSFQTTIGVDSSEDEEEIERGQKEDEEEEKKMMQLDIQHEEELSQYLGFYDESKLHASKMKKINEELENHTREVELRARKRKLKNLELREKKKQRNESPSSSVND